MMTILNNLLSCGKCINSDTNYKLQINIQCVSTLKNF